MNPPPFAITYLFTLADNSTERFDLTLDPLTLEICGGHLPEPSPDWTMLAFHQCPHCPCIATKTPVCPAAANLIPLVQRLNHLVSYDKLALTVVTAERTVSQNTTAQRAISSLMGLLIAASRCPHTHFFKPMARFHLPLASEEETIYRATANYLLAQYFLKENDQPPDFILDGLSVIYRNMQIVNRAMAERLRPASKTDSSINAIILLDMCAKTMPYAIDTKLEDIRQLFAPYASGHAKNDAERPR